MIRIFFVVVILSLAIFLSYLALSSALSGRSDPNKPVTLTVWGVNDDPAIMERVIEGYRKRHPNVTINYAKQSLTNYRSRIQSQISANQAADIVAVHSSWLPMFLQGNSLFAAPAEVFNQGSFGRSFYKVASDSFLSGGKVYAVPNEVDGLALFVNNDILKGQGLKIPDSWDELVTAAVKTTVVDQSGAIRTAGLAFGSTGNVRHWSEILGLLFAQQPNARVDRPDSDSGKEVFNFFKRPTGDDKKRTWDNSLGEDSREFAQGRLTFYFGKASDARAFKSQNPNLNFTVVPTPQLPNKDAGFGCFWGYGVSSKSKNPTEAWKFLKFLTDAETEKYIYSEETRLYNGLGKPYARSDLQNSLASDPINGAFVAQGPIYKSWYLCSDTKDQGLNDEMVAAFQAAVNGGSLADLQTSIQTILAKYTTPAKR